MSDIAEYVIEQGLDMLTDHSAGHPAFRTDDCEVCREEEYEDDNNRRSGMAKSIKIGAGWNAVDKTWLATGRISRADIITALEQTPEGEDIPFMVFSNDFKKTEKHPDFYLNFRKKEEEAPRKTYTEGKKSIFGGE
jgi:hypothetical protein